MTPHYIIVRLDSDQDYDTVAFLKHDCSRCNDNTHKYV